jgi:S-DNA-T family DNA segregation ATPase FtsK/SpoIIIE
MAPTPAPRAPVALIGRADDPDRQIQRPFAWDTARGNLLLYGVAGSGTTTTLLTIVTALARERTADDLHVYALDFGSGGLQPLESLPHTGAVVAAGEHERQVRLLRMLSGELERRRRRAAAGDLGDQSMVLVVLDNWRGFQTAFDDMDGLRLRDDLARLIADGPALGMRTVVTADQPNAIPLAVASLVSERLIFRLADRHDYSAFGLAGRAPSDLCPGRGFDAASGLEVQIACPDFNRVNGRPAISRRPFDVGVLPATVALDRLPTAATPLREGDDDAFRIPVGLGGDSLATVELAFAAADHALIAGPARSGRSAALITVAQSARATRPDLVITAIALRRSPLTAAANVDRVVTAAADVGGALAAVHNDKRPQLVLIDDAEGVDDPASSLSGLLQRHRVDLHVVAAGRADAIRGQYGHWTRDLRRSRLGIALQPAPDDGDLWSASFPRRAAIAALPGRGYLIVDGRVELVQVAR